MKILLLRLSSIGDIVLTSPVIRCLKQQVPNCELHFLVKEQFKIVLENNPYIDQLHLFSGNLSENIAALKKEQFAWIIDLHNNQRTFLIKKRLGVKSKSFYKANVEKALMVRLKWNRLPDKHIVDRYMDTVAHLNVQNDGQGLDYFIPIEDKVNLQELGLTQSLKFIAFSIGGAHATKRMPKEKILNICEGFSLPIVLLGGKTDSSVGEWVLNNASQNEIHNFCGKLNLNQSVSLLEQSAWVITHDTGLMHIAAALDKPITAIWGNTIPAFGMTPYPKNPNSQYTNIEVNDLNCRPCSKIGFEACPKGHFRCMQEISVEAVWDSISLK